MIKQMIHQVAESSPCQFQRLDCPAENIEFYKAGNSNHQRFLVVLDADQLSTPSELNEKVQEITPQALQETPSFAKNTDLILLFRLDSLAKLHQYEHSIFDIEENAYSLKKHVLYYTTGELEQLKQYLDLGESIETLVTNPELFNHYKHNSSEETAFSLACRLYVKLPFLAVPAKESILTSANQLADQLLSEKKLLVFFNSIEQQLSAGHGYQDVMEALIDEQMAD
ncbi:ABC-three component system middle component 1 [Vibrio fluvialis]|uniref:ABC-three component system middle component 1 n=1 Tax=Vibrio fluvialis TaxID=676 RepID=UPI00301D93D6